MTITIRPLNPKDGSAFVDFFGRLSFEHAQDWAGCYCQYYLLGEGTEWEKRSATDNKASALECIENQRMQGYLAIDGEDIVGWCHANRLTAFPGWAARAELKDKAQESGAIMCFVIHPDYRGGGLASRMLGAAVEGFKQAGAARVYGFPFESEQNPQRNYHGTFKMYERMGFLRAGGSDQYPIYCLELS